MLNTLDWIIIAVLLLVIFAIGIYFGKNSGKSLQHYFLGGRNLPWYLAGISMVATTFAADTPLAVTELIGQYGISGNWLWWNLLAGGMLTTFFFANMWRRANILTEVEFVEVRYSGKAAGFLRSFKALYLGLFMNVLIIGWVNLAMTTILSGFFGIPESEAFWYTALAMLFVAAYSSISGLMGVVMTDAVQFVIAMTGSIALSVFVVNSNEIGGLSGLVEKVPTSALNFLPNIGENTGETLAISFGAFFAYFGMMWWSSWYPGAEPGGGGYIAQRMMSTKNEKHAVWATLFFQVAHYCLRPWPWILVGLSAIVLFKPSAQLPDAMLQQQYEEVVQQDGFKHSWLVEKKVPADISPEALSLREPLMALAEKDSKLAESLHYQSDLRYGYIYAMKRHMPNGWLGLMLVAFFAAYMSTISTQLNWGASYLINDVYLRNSSKAISDKKQIQASQWMVIVLMIIGLIVSNFIHSISGVWQFIMECGAGLGLVLILRWYWWRINVWSEISATIAPFVALAIAHVLNLEFPNSFFFTVGFTTITWIVVTFSTQPESRTHLQSFYDRIKPEGFWGPFHGPEVDLKTKRIRIISLFLSWISAVIFTYALLFTTGKTLLLQWEDAGYSALTAIASFVLLRSQLKKTQIFFD